MQTAMKNSCVIIFLLGCLCQCIRSKQEGFAWSHERSTPQAGRRLEGSVIGVEHGIYLATQCAGHCLVNSACMSYNIITSTNICQMNSGTHLQPGGLLVIDPDSWYYERNAFEIERAALGPCLAEDACKNGGHCVSQRGEDFLCSCTENWTGRRCEVAVHLGEWTEWSPWTECSLSCGKGWQVRARNCSGSSSRSESNSSGCLGPERDYKECTERPCSTRWSDWSDWTSCSTDLTCGRGIKTRAHTCSVSEICHGNENETTICENPSCTMPVRLVGGAVYGEGIVEVYDVTTDSWGSVCGEGWTQEDATVVCRQHGFNGSTNETVRNMTTVRSPFVLYNVSCSGSELHLARCGHHSWAKPDNKSCSTPASVRCNVHGSWGSWSEWSECSLTCGEGMRSRNRRCDSPAPLGEGEACNGQETEVVICQLGTCTSPGGFWSEWGEWMFCSVTCDGGIRQRKRNCTLPSTDSEPCTGENNEQEACNQFPCTPYLKSCTLLREAGMTDSTMVQIDPLGFGVPFWVRCNMMDMDGIGITEIVHDQLGRKRAGTDVGGEFQLDISYNATTLQMENLIDVSEDCRQYVSFECRSARINSARSNGGGLPVTYAIDRYGELISYWAGGDPEHPNMCECGVAGTCQVEGSHCNCDANDEVLRKDDGFFRQKQLLPISRVVTSGTGLCLACCCSKH